MILYIENLKKLTKTLLQLISSYSKVAGYQVNIQISIAFLYTSSEQVEFEIENTIELTLAPPLVKYTGINLKKYLYEENGKKNPLMTEIKKN